MSDEVVFEQGQLTSGTTWHAAGLIVAGLLKSESECEIYTHGRDLYANLEKEPGLPTGFRDVGYLQIANNEERVHEIRRLVPFMRRCGINIHEISPKEAAELFPIGDLRQACVTPHVAQKSRNSAIGGRTTRHEGFALSIKHRKRIELAFGWAKTLGGMAQTVYRVVERMRSRFILTMAANNLARLPRLFRA